MVKKYFMSRGLQSNKYGTQLHIQLAAISFYNINTAVYSY